MRLWVENVEVCDPCHEFFIKTSSEKGQRFVLVPDRIPLHFPTPIAESIFAIGKWRDIILRSQETLCLSTSETRLDPDLINSLSEALLSPSFQHTVSDIPRFSSALENLSDRVQKNLCSLLVERSELMPSLQVCFSHRKKKSKRSTLT